MKVRPFARLLPLALGSGLAIAGCSGDPSGYALTANTEVILDRHGVPHLYGQTDEDVFFASGFVLAKLRSAQIEIVRRQALGTSAEVLGQKGLRADIAARTFAFATYGKKDRERISQEHPREAALIRAFVSGINQFVDRVHRGDEPLPAGFGSGGLASTPSLWSHDDPYIIGKMLSFGMSSSLDAEILATVLQKLSPKLAEAVPLSMPVRPAFALPSEVRPALGQASGPPAPQREAPPSVSQAELEEALAHYERIQKPLGSNNWAVSGRFTENGRPLLSGDPHQPLGSPIRFYAQHLSSARSGGSLDVIGFSFAGTPGVQLGHNRTLGWTATTNFADVMDLWDVSFAEGGKEILLWGRKEAVTLRREVVRIRKEGGSETEMESKELLITDVPSIGVLLPEELLPVPKALLVKGELLFAWTGFAPTTEAVTYLGFDRATSLAEFEDAARKLEVGAANFVYADAKSIRYKVHAKIPDRGSPKDRPLPYQIMDGQNPKTRWPSTYLDEGKLPSLQEPQRGYLVTANNDPLGFTEKGRPQDAPYYYGYFYDPGDRAYRIEEELKSLVSRGKVRASDMVSLQNDAYSVMADDLLQALGEGMLAIGTDPALAPFRNRPDLFDLFRRLSEWDRQMRRGSEQAVIFFGFAHFAAKRALLDDFGPTMYAVFQAEPSYPLKILRLALLGKFKDAGSILQGGKSAILVAALADTADWLKARFGGLSEGRFAWRDLHGARFASSLGASWDGGVTPVDGSIGTVNVSAATLFDGGGKLLERVSSDDGPLYRMTIGFDGEGMPQASYNFPRGNQEDPASSHFNDRLKDWVEGVQQPLVFRRADVEAAMERRYTLRPGGGLE